MLGINSALANAYRQINAAFARLPSSQQEAIAIDYDDLDREIDVAILAGDRDRALNAITAWRDHWRGVFADNGAARSDPRTAVR